MCALPCFPESEARSRGFTPGVRFSLTPPVMISPGGVNHNAFIVMVRPPGRTWGGINENFSPVFKRIYYLLPVASQMRCPMDESCLDLAKFCKNRRLAPPSTGNPGSAPDSYSDMCG